MKRIIEAFLDYAIPVSFTAFVVAFVVVNIWRMCRG